MKKKNHFQIKSWKKKKTLSNQVHFFSFKTHHIDTQHKNTKDTISTGLKVGCFLFCNAIYILISSGAFIYTLYAGDWAPSNWKIIDLLKKKSFINYLNHWCQNLSNCCEKGDNKCFLVSNYSSISFHIDVVIFCNHLLMFFIK